MNPSMIILKSVIASFLVFSFQLYAAASSDSNCDGNYAACVQIAKNFLEEAQKKALKDILETQNGVGIPPTFEGVYGIYHIKAVPASVYKNNQIQEVSLQSLFKGDSRIIPIFARVVARGYHFIFTEKTSYSYLKDYIEQNYWDKDDQVPEDILKIIFLQILNIAELVHGKDVFFNGFTEKNFVVKDDYPSIFLIDFSSGSEKTGIFSEDRRGHPAYLSPEKSSFMAGHMNCYLAEEADVWSLGVLLYYLTNHSYPFSLDKKIAEVSQDDGYDPILEYGKDPIDILCETEEEFDKCSSDLRPSRSVELKDLLFKLLNKRENQEFIRIRSIDKIKNHP